MKNIITLALILFLFNFCTTKQNNTENLSNNENLDSFKVEHVTILELKRVANTNYIKVKFFKQFLNEDYEKHEIINKDGRKDLVYDNDTIFNYEYVPNFEGYFKDKSRPITLFKVSRNVQMSFQIEYWDMPENASLYEKTLQTQKLNLIKNDKFLYLKQNIPSIFDIKINTKTNEVIEIFEYLVP